jgi:hypothetical protein
LTVQLIGNFSFNASHVSYVLEDLAVCPVRRPDVCTPDI